MIRAIPIAVLLMFRLVGCDPSPEDTDAGSPVSDAHVPEITTDAGPPSDAGEACVRACTGRSCGDDGCGGSCGACPAGTACSAGECAATCPANASFSGDSCFCNAGYAPDVSCSFCEVDTDRNGCPAHATPTGGECLCDDGYEREGCGCVPDGSPPEPTCGVDETMCGDACIPDLDHDSCPDHGRPLTFSGGCTCHEGYVRSADGCACEPLPSYDDPAFDTSSCAGAAMSHEDAEARWSASDGTLGSYQMKFRRRSCDELGCGPWVEVPLTEIPWRTRASGLVELQRRSGVMNVDLHNAWCVHHHYLNSSRYNIGAACSGVGATLTCSTYRLPGLCRGPSLDSEPYQLFGRNLSFFGTMTDDCVQLIADVDISGGEAQAAVLVRF